MTLTLRPHTEAVAPEISVDVSEDKWNSEVSVRFLVPAELAEQALASLPFPGAIAPVEGGEARTRGKLLTTLDAAASTDFDPWAMAHAPRVEMLLGLDEGRRRKLLAAVVVCAYREVIERGKFALHALNACRINGLTAPQWLWDAFGVCFSRVETLQVGSLDEAFAHPQTTDKKREPVARRLALRDEVMAHLIDEVLRSPTMAINKALHQLVGKRCGITAKQCEEIYYEARAAGFQDLTYLKKKLLAELRLSGRSGRKGRIRTKRPRR